MGSKGKPEREKEEILFSKTESEEGIINGSKPRIIMRCVFALEVGITNEPGYPIRILYQFRFERTQKY